MSPDPFGALGLPARPDLTDDDVRAAWRRVAAATHPDRADGGDPDRFAVAAAAYTDLRTRDGRGEAYADLRAGTRWRASAGTRPPPGGWPEPVRQEEQAPAVPRPARRGAGPLARLAWRVRRGRPALLVLRLIIAAAITAAAFAVTGAQPAAYGLAAGAATWLALTARHDFAPRDGAVVTD